MSERGASLYIPGTVLAEIKPLAARMSRAGVEMPWNRVALAALEKGAKAIRDELERPPPTGEAA